ncbi:DNA -binding domain-containing protein [Gluconobacter japonicus]|uniref:DNA -binding domain-containing protein n=1 Tax=Gluconobacter japonicus TaxID=376620 RepID=UPI0009EDCDE2|nr:DUF2285 domain-containing protein [Gluconobacter japonicus]
MGGHRLNERQVPTPRIGAVVVDFRSSKADWEGDLRKNQTRRLVADGLLTVRGGYRDLLHYPFRLPNHVGLERLY